MPFDRHASRNRSSMVPRGFAEGLIPTTSTVEYRNGDVSADDADLLVNTVNCVNVMGKGVALAFKRRFPTIMAAYGDACRSKLLVPGGCLLLSLPDGRKWAALATKNHRSEERREGKESVSTCRYRWSPNH